MLHAGKIKAYIQLCLAISAQALNTKAASPTRPVTDNPKYTFDRPSLLSAALATLGHCKQWLSLVSLSG